MRHFLNFKIIQITLVALLILLVLAPSSFAALKNNHPRLMSQDWINKLSEWSNDPYWEPWQKFKSFADSKFGNTYDSGRLFARALMWKMGKGEAYLTSCLSNFDTVINSVGTSVDKIAANALYIAYAYDLLYEKLPVSSQKNAVDQFIAWQDVIKKSSWVNNKYVLIGWSIRRWMPAFVAAAAGTYDPSNSANDLEAEYNYWKTNYFNAALYWANRVFHGPMPSGTYYGTVTRMAYFLHAVDAVYMADDNTVYSSNIWFNNTPTYLWQAYSIPYKFIDPISQGYGWYYHAWDQSERLRDLVPFHARLNLLLLLTRLTNHPYRGQIYNYLYENADSDLNKARYTTTDYGALWAFIYGCKDLKATSEPQSLKFWYTNLNTDYGPGYVFMRTGYTPQDIYISFKCGDMLSRGHDNLGEGTFQLWARGEDLAIHGGAYDGSGEFAQTSDYYARTVSMNGIIVYDPKEKFWFLGSARDNDGGQRSYTDYPADYVSSDGRVDSAFKDWLNNSHQPGGASNPPGVNIKGKLLKAEYVKDKFSYVLGDVTRAYNSDKYVEGSVNSSKIQRLTRELSLIGNKYVLIFDRLIKKNSTHKDKWLLHTQTSFYVNGIETKPSDGEQVYTNSNGSFYTVVNKAKLYGQVVYPNKDFLIRRFNGNKRYWNYVKNVEYGNNQGNWYNIEWGADRIEIESTINNLKSDYLVVLYPSDTSIISMPATNKVTSAAGNMKGVFITAGGGSPNWVAMFNATDSNIKNVDFTVDGRGTVALLLFGLQPNSQYKVYKNKILLADVNSTSQGTLYLETSLAGLDSFSVVLPSLPSLISNLANSLLGK